MDLLFRVQGSPKPNSVPGVLVIHADERMTLAGREMATPEAFLETLGDEAREAVRIVPDRDLSAEALVRIGRALRAGGAERVLIVSERGLE